MTTQEILKPISSSERINSIDIIRGVALLGILLMNITGFGLYKAYFNPINSGGSTGLNLTVWWINSMFFEGTMRGLFSMLFGAGIFLFTNRTSENTWGSNVTDLFFRRLLWLLFFGVIHSYLLLWDGEILYAYAIAGMFAFSFRHLKPKQLIIWATVFLLIGTARIVGDYYQHKQTFETVTAANLKKSKNETLSKEESKSIKEWDELVENDNATPEQLKDEIAERNKGYFSIVMHKAHENQVAETTGLYLYNFWDILAMMLLGIAFLKTGILKAAKSTRFYWIMALIGYAIGLCTNYFETNLIISNNFSILSIYKSFNTYHLGRVATIFGHIAVIALFIKSGWLPFLQKSLAAVGRMAFTNYIMHTIICITIFMGFGFGMYGKLQRYELYYVVFSIWIFQLIVSPIWLKYFRFGPLEWMWRSLTYWEIQPFRNTKK
jgi:uncharacterized protein